MSLWQSSPILAFLSGGPLHSLHWLVLFAAFLLFGWSVVGSWRISTIQKKRQLSRRSFTSLVSALRRNERSDEQMLPEKSTAGKIRMPTWVRTLATSAKRYLTIMGREASPALDGERASEVIPEWRSSVWTKQQEADNMVEQERQHRNLRGAGILWPILFAAVVGAALTYFATHIKDNPTYEYRNVKVLARVGADSWWIEREDGPTLWNCCLDFNCENVIQAGYVMRKFRYEDFGTCKSILRPDLGVWWDRDPITKNVKEIDHANGTAR